MRGHAHIPCLSTSNAALQVMAYGSHTHRVGISDIQGLMHTVQDADDPTLHRMDGRREGHPPAT